MAKKNIVLVAGGYTGESVISMKSAAVIESQLDKEKYNVFKIIISKEEWILEGKPDVQVDKNDFSITIEGKKINFDCAFIIVHGTPGEDGKLQGYFDMVGIPYTTCDAATSAITMNKAYTKQVVDGISQLYIARSKQLFKKQFSSADEINNSLNYPLFIKPNNGGSSIGMSKVNEKGALQEALDKAFDEDEQVIVEEFIKGREFTVGVVKIGGVMRVLPVTEIISSKEFFDYEAKYTPGVSNEITPADLNEEQLKRVQAIVLEIYKRLNCKGVVRIDFIIDEKTGHFYFLEINTVPGQSENSIIPQQVRATGMSMKEFYSGLIEEAIS